MKPRQFFAIAGIKNWPAANALFVWPAPAPYLRALRTLRPSPQAVSALSGYDHLSWDAPRSLSPALHLVAR
ncbi:hypothetical protein ATB93_16210 [Sphingomonas sp. WG]|nr:hypothetical protein ATB93_16210 [Sphingomonas sp. WG]